MTYSSPLLAPVTGDTIFILVVSEGVLFCSILHVHRHESPLPHSSSIIVGSFQGYFGHCRCGRFFTGQRFTMIANCRWTSALVLLFFGFIVHIRLLSHVKPCSVCPSLLITPIGTISQPLLTTICTLTLCCIIVETSRL